MEQFKYVHTFQRMEILIENEMVEERGKIFMLLGKL